MIYEQWHCEVCAELPTKGLPRELAELFRLAWAGPESYKVDMSQLFEGAPSDLQRNIQAARQIADVMRQITTKRWAERAKNVISEYGFVVPLRWRWNTPPPPPNLITVPAGPGRWAFLYSVATACAVAWSDGQLLPDRDEARARTDRSFSDALTAVDALIAAMGRMDARFIPFSPMLITTVTK